MKSTNLTKTILMTAAAALSLSACADNNAGTAEEAQINVDEAVEEASDTLSVFEPSDPVDLDNADFATVNPDQDLYGAQEQTTDQRKADAAVIKARAMPMDEKQTASRKSMDEKSDMRAQAKAVKAEVDAVCKNKVNLADPAMDGDMSFAAVDRDGNNMLSPAEFAIYDLSNINPMVKCDKDDGTRPFVSTKALNMSSDDFIRFDTNGDVAISREEFRAMTS